MPPLENRASFGAENRATFPHDAVSAARPLRPRFRFRAATLVPPRAPMRAASGELLRVLAVDTAQSACAACVIQAGEAEPLARDRCRWTAAMRSRCCSSTGSSPRSTAVREPGPRRRHDRARQLYGPQDRHRRRPRHRARRRRAGRRRRHALRLLAPLMSGETRGLMGAAVDAKHGQIYVQVVAPGGGPSSRRASWGAIR